MSIEEYGPLGEPIPLDSELTENSTYYDRLIAGPDDATKHQLWMGWSISFLLISFYATSVLIPVIATKKTRRSPFNCYLIFLMIPDVLGTLLCGLSCLTNTISGGFAGGTAACYFQSFYLITFVSINAWLNAVTARQLLIMLQSAAHFTKYQPPTRKRVALEAMACYAIGMFIASWGIYRAADQMDWFPHHTWLVYGTLCVPQPFDDPSMIFFYTVYFPAMLLIPFLYVLYAGTVIWKRNLLPPEGKRRVLAIYFFRLAAVFIVMWIPALIMLFISGAWSSNAWVEWFGGLWGHCQVIVSATLSLMKPDISTAFREFYYRLFVHCCPCFTGDDDGVMGTADDGSSYYGAASFYRKTSTSGSLGMGSMDRISNLGIVSNIKRLKKKLSHNRDPEIQKITLEIESYSLNAIPCKESDDSVPFAGDEEAQSGVMFAGQIIRPAESAQNQTQKEYEEDPLQDPNVNEHFEPTRRRSTVDLPDDFSYNEDDLRGFDVVDDDDLDRSLSHGCQEEDHPKKPLRRRRSSIAELFHLRKRQDDPPREVVKGSESVHDGDDSSELSE